MTKTAAVYGGNGFIGHHVARRLRKEGYWVRTVDINPYTFGEIDYTDDYVIADLRVKENVFENMLVDGKPVDELYVLSSWMGGAGVIFTGKYDDEILYNSLTIDLNCAKYAAKLGVKKLFWSSSACCYNATMQNEGGIVYLKETVHDFPAWPDSDYGFGKLTSEKIYQAFHRNKGLNIRIARFHNIYGEEGSWNNNKEKFPAAICRKVSEAKDGDEIEIWGTGEQIRSFLYINECVDGIIRLMESDFKDPINIGSSMAITINDLAKMVIGFSGKNLKIKNIQSDAIGVLARSSDNELCKKVLGWTPDENLEYGMKQLFNWVNKMVNK